MDSYDPRQNVERRHTEWNGPPPIQSHIRQASYPGGPIQRGTSPESPPNPNVGTQPDDFSYEPRAITPPNVEGDECYAWFVTVDQDGNGQLSPEELRSALLNDGGLSFSASTVNYLMSIFDRDSNGTIGFEEFEPLWKYMTQWRQMFESFDEDSDERIDASELDRALAHYELHVGPSILDLLVKKYGIPPRNGPPSYGHPPRLQLDLDHFLCACVVVQQMCALYDSCNPGGQADQGSGSPTISRDEFIRAVISLP
ncbi:hypothetical protein BC826DRAFT_529110 [Russula brevipes]|nr:hypothetical protein BC826DRAFT_529110 [Russula brevipes]